MATAGLYGIVAHPRKLGPMLAWGILMLAVVAPWAWATYQTYGRPFYSYTDFFQYTFSWTVHHYQAGTPRATDFYARENLAEIARVKIKALFIIVGYSTMIVSVPVMLAFWRRVFSHRRTEVDRLVAWIVCVFVVSTLVRIADVTQVAQLGRYYLPVFCLMLPTAAAGLADWCKDWQVPKRAGGADGVDARRRSCGPTRLGHTTRVGSPSLTSSTGPPFARRATGSRLIQTRSRPTRGS